MIKSTFRSNAASILCFSMPLTEPSFNSIGILNCECDVRPSGRSSAAIPVDATQRTVCQIPRCLILVFAVRSIGILEFRGSGVSLRVQIRSDVFLYRVPLYLISIYFEIRWRIFDIFTTCSSSQIVYIIVLSCTLQSPRFVLCHLLDLQNLLFSFLKYPSDL